MDLYPKGLLIKTKTKADLLEKRRKKVERQNLNRSVRKEKTHCVKSPVPWKTPEDIGITSIVEFSPELQAILNKTGFRNWDDVQQDLLISKSSDESKREFENQILIEQNFIYERWLEQNYAYWNYFDGFDKKFDCGNNSKNLSQKIVKALNQHSQSIPEVKPFAISHRKKKKIVSTVSKKTNNFCGNYDRFFYRGYYKNFSAFIYRTKSSAVRMEIKEYIKNLKSYPTMVKCNSPYYSVIRKSDPPFTVIHEMVQVYYADPCLESKTDCDCIMLNLVCGPNIQKVNVYKHQLVDSLKKLANHLLRITNIFETSLFHGIRELQSHDYLDSYNLLNYEYIIVSFPLLGSGKTGTLQLGSTGNGASSSNTKNQYSNLNLNQNNLSSVTNIQSFDKSSKSSNNLFKKNDSKTEEENGRKNNYKPIDSTKSMQKLSFNTENGDVKEKQKGVETKKGNNSSTLSLHIAAYENSVEAAAVENHGNDMNKNVSKFGKNNWKIEKKNSDVSSSMFEFPRQQEDATMDPEIMQFKASQKLFNPNELQNTNANENQRDVNNKTCFFNFLHEQNPEFVSTGCQSNSLKSLSVFGETPYDKTIHSELEILLARVGIFKPLDKNYENLNICEDHVKEFLTKWGKPEYRQQLTRKKDGLLQKVCSFPDGYGTDHKNLRPFSCKCVVTYEKAQLFWEKYNQLIQVGLHICNAHNIFLNNLTPKNDLPDSSININAFDAIASDALDDSSSDNNDSPSHSGDEDYEPQQKSIVPKSPKEAAVGKAISTLAAAAGISRTGTRGNYSSLADDSQRKKVQNFDKMIHVVADYMAPGNPDTLIEAFVERNAHCSDSSATTINQILQDHAEWFYVANNYKEKTEVLAQIARRFHFEQIRQFIPDLTLCRFTAARKLALQRYNQWKQPVKKVIRVRYNKEFLNLFVEFITSSYVIVDLPFGIKKAKLSSGEKIDIPNTLRRFHKHEIIKMFEKWLIEIDRPDVKLGYSTMNKALDIAVASQKIAMHCVNYFIANGDEAFDSLLEILDNLEKTGLIENLWMKDLKKLIFESKNYLKTDYRLNVKKFSQCPDHCIMYGLSDPTNSNFCASKCDELVENGHDHGVKCDRCSILTKAICKLTEKIDFILSQNEDDLIIQEKLNDFKEVISKNETTINDLKSHILRAVYSDKVRSDIIENLQEGEAFATLDYIMKFNPMKNLQTQNDWFGLRGISWHCTTIFAKIGGKIVQHSIIHILGFEKQDAKTVTTIIRDVLTKLKSWKIRNISFRADNASCYHNTELLINLFLMAGTLDIVVKRFSFSEAQNGKSSADTEAARLKRIIRNWIDSGHNVETIFELFAALQSGAVPLCAITVVVAKVIGKDFEAKNTLTGISKVSDVEYDYAKKELVYWQHYKIGQGQRIKVNNYLNLKLNAKLEILQTTQHHPDDEDYLFWRPLNLASSEIKKSQIEKILDDEINNENNANFEEAISSKNYIYPCTTDGCISSFTTFGWLQRHILIGKHEFSKDSCTLNDFVIKQYARKLEGITPKLPELLKIVENCNPNDNEEESVKQGWALKKPPTRTIYTSDMKEFLDTEFKVHQDQGKRIDPKEVQKKMAEIKNRQRKNRFKAKERLNSMQIGRYYAAKLKKLRGENEIEDKEDASEIDDNVLHDEPMFMDNFEAFFDSIEDWSELIPRGKENGEFEETIEEGETEISALQEIEIITNPELLISSNSISPTPVQLIASPPALTNNSTRNKRRPSANPETISKNTPKKSRK